MKAATIYEIILGFAFTGLIFFASSSLAGVFLKDEGLIGLVSLFLKLMCFHAPFLGIMRG